MPVKKKIKSTAFKPLKDLAAVNFTDFNKRRAFRALSNLSTKLILHDFKLIKSDIYEINNKTF